jgi:hypothetical protein
MSVNINADTTNGLVLTSDTSGEIKLQSAGTDIATVDSSGITMAAGKTIPAASLTGTLPAIDGSSLTGVPGVGVGQTWQNLTSSRALGTTYTNSTGSPIMIAVTVNTTASTNSKAKITVGGVEVTRTYPYASGVYTPMYALVPDGATYVATNVSNTTLNRWTELR